MPISLKHIDEMTLKKDQLRRKVTFGLLYTIKNFRRNDCVTDLAKRTRFTYSHTHKVLKDHPHFFNMRPNGRKTLITLTERGKTLKMLSIQLFRLIT